MTDVAAKKRMARVKTLAIEKLIDVKYKIIPSDNSLFCFVAVRDREIRLIRIAIDSVSTKEIDEVKEFAPPGICSKEIWCKKGRKFEITEI